MKIAFDAAASQTVRFAASELEKYLTKMLPSTSQLAFRLTVTGRQPLDAFSVRIAADGGEICGVNDRSVLLGVYDYLHRLGCRFLAPGADCEVIPAISPQALPAAYEKRASFRHRGVCIEGADSRENILDFIDWLPKLGYNSFFFQFKVPFAFLARWYQHQGNPHLKPEAYRVEDAQADTAALEAELKKRGLMLHKVGHGWTGEVLGYQTVSWDQQPRPLAPEKRAMAAEIAGRRELWQGSPANTNLCFHNGDAVDAFARLVVNYARENPAVDYLHVWLADEYNNVCECSGCRQTTPSDQYVALLNEIDRRLTAEGLPTRIVFLLYQELLWPPIREKLAHPDRFVLMFAPISRTFESSYDLSGPEVPVPAFVRNHIVLPTNLQENLAFLRGWQRLFHGDSFVYDYPLGRAHYGDLGYVHIARVISSDIKQLHKMGLDGYISCQELRVCLPNALPNYIMGYTLFDESADPQALIQEYFSAAYGARAGEILSYLDTLSDLSSCDYLNGKGPRTDPAIAGRMEQVSRLCRDVSLDAAGDGCPLFWEILHYHRDYVLALSRALGALAGGDARQAADGWYALRELICQNEQKYQPFLDVYRVLEVTRKYTGFPLSEE